MSSLKALIKVVIPTLKMIERGEEHGGLNEEQLKATFEPLFDSFLPPQTELKEEICKQLNELIRAETLGMMQEVILRIVLAGCNNDPKAMREKIDKLVSKLIKILKETT